MPRYKLIPEALQDRPGLSLAGEVDIDVLLQKYLKTPSSTAEEHWPHNGVFGLAGAADFSVSNEVFRSQQRSKLSLPAKEGPQSKALGQRVRNSGLNAQAYNAFRVTGGAKGAAPAKSKRGKECMVGEAGSVVFYFYFCI